MGSFRCPIGFTQSVVVGCDYSKVWTIIHTQGMAIEASNLLMAFLKRLPAGAATFLVLHKGGIAGSLELSLAP